MRKIDLDELRNIQLYILDEFHDYCQKNNLRYSLGYGTLLGAIRHKGYIPWDDDIDIMMPRKDYDTFCQKFSHEKLNIFSHETDKHCHFIFTKLGRKDTILKDPLLPSYIGVNMDIFPLDGLPDNETAGKIYFKWILLLVRIYCIRARSFKNKRKTKEFKNAGVGKKVIYIITNLIAFVFPKSLLSKAISFLSKKYKFENSKYVACLMGGSHIHEGTEYKYMSTLIDVLFEEKSYKAVSGYDSYLSNVFGDYMKLPPLEERVQHTSEFWIES